MNNRLVAGCMVVGLLLVLFPVAPAFSQIDWTGLGADNLWSNPDNWAGGFIPTAGDRVIINGPAALEPNGPVIEDGIDAVAALLIAEAGVPTMTMTGGTLELAGWGTWWADGGGTATFNMSGGVVNFTGEPGIMEVGWQDMEAPVATAVGRWVITGGEINAKGVDLPGKGREERFGIGAISLFGGTLNVGTARGGLDMHTGGRIDITEGLLVLEGDQEALVEGFVEEDFILAYDGQGTVQAEYDGDFTYVIGVQNLPCDFDGDQLCDIVDLDALLFEALGTVNPRFDLDGSGGPIDLGDRDAWLSMAGDENIAVPYVLGDTDLNGKVDALDLNNLGLSWQRDDVDSWQLGDFNGDNTVNASDLNDLGLNWQHGAPAAASGVPEPAGMMMLIIGVCGLLVGRPRRM